jgi:prephenate dehydratase
MRVGYLGPAGTYSEEALRAHPLEGMQALPIATVHDTVMAVQDGEVERAIVPIENSIEGGVAATVDALAGEARDVRIVGEVVHPVHHCLVSGRPVELDRIVRVISHPQALGQCARFLRERLPHAERVATGSTADAVRSAHDAAEPVAALGSRLAAELYDCHVLAEDVADHPGNVTRFVWLAKASDDDEPDQRATKTSVVFWGAGDESPGWLVGVLGELAGRGVNLTRIESRPLRVQLGHYMFFADLEGAAHTEPVAGALAALRERVETIRILGSYADAPS